MEDQKFDTAPTDIWQARGNGTVFQIRSAYRDLCDWQAMRCPRLEVAAFE
jgi:hypothetical protein